MRRYITTAIDYPNAPPHMGHVLEKVLADAIARWWRLSGDEVRFQIGTDEHGVKIEQTADREGITPKELVDRNVPLFKDLYHDLNISSDHFIRTTDQEEHWPTVRELWIRLAKAGVLEKKKYKGLYCTGCERFMTKKDLIDGKCPNHQRVPEEVTEENWFFLLSKEAAWLKKLLKNDYKIVPDFRAPETLSLIEQGLEDVSFSRPKESLEWGIPVPGDESQVMYVWCDALTNYISSLGFFTDHEDRSYWDSPAEVTHVIGKDIARFHALIWPAMLKHAGVRIPDRLLIHGFITSDGQKMSKSIGNTVDPTNVIEKYGVDALRFYLLHEIPVGNDGDFSWERFTKLYDAKLRNDIGNLLNRVLVLMNKEDGYLGSMKKEEEWEGWGQYEKKMNDLDLFNAIQDPLILANLSNRYIDARKVWALKGKEKKEELSFLAERLRHIALLLLPFVPGTAQEISRQLNVPYADRMLDKDFVLGDLKEWGACKDWKRIGEPKILFAPVL
ncbi:methionine--tRNA ligase [Candidatus Peregrinibacteria bacterium]|nr:methionine--tRNA ligase [Candidatus Peregrinibacteria bacterium]